MVYLMASEEDKYGSIAFHTESNEELQQFVKRLRKELKKMGKQNIKITIVTNQKTYSKYDLIHFVNSYDEFERIVKQF